MAYHAFNNLRLPRMYWAITILALVVLALLVTAFISSRTKTSDNNPLAGTTLYRDDQREVTKLEASYRKSGKTADADLLAKISSQPNATWLTGPHASDTTAQEDVDDVIRTSSEALSQNKTPLYVLYAIPQRDVCAGF